MEIVQALMGALFNVVLVVVLIAAMLSAGFSTTIAMLGQVLKRFWLVLLVFVSALVIRPLVGWGAAELFNLSVPAFIALVMAASVPGAPLGVIFAMKAKADISVAATFQVLLALVAAFTFAPTANLILQAANLGQEISLPVADMVKTIVVLQVIPFVVGLLVRHFNEEAALDWNETCKKITGPGLLAVIALGLLGSWQMIIDLIGDRVILAAIVFTVATGGFGRVVIGTARLPRRNLHPLTSLLQPARPSPSSCVRPQDLSR